LTDRHRSNHVSSRFAKIVIESSDSSSPQLNIGVSNGNRNNGRKTINNVKANIDADLNVPWPIVESGLSNVQPILANACQVHSRRRAPCPHHMPRVRLDPFAHQPRRNRRSQDTQSQQSYVDDNLNEEDSIVSGDIERQSAHNAEIDAVENF